MKLVIIVFSLFVLASCASKPKLYPNQKLQQVGPEVANQDIAACMSDADNFVGSEKGKNILKGAGSGAAVSGVIGGVASGIFSGNILRGALQGAAIGGAAGATGGALTPNRLKMSFVNRCLSEKGYEIIGWN